MSDFFQLLRVLWRTAASVSDPVELDRLLLEQVLRHYRADKGLIAQVGRCPNPWAQRNCDQQHLENMENYHESITPDTIRFYRHAVMHGAAVDTLVFSPREREEAYFVQHFLLPEQVSSAAVVFWPCIHEGLSNLAVWQTRGKIDEEQETQLRCLARYMPTLRSQCLDSGMESAVAFVRSLSKHQQKIAALVASGRSNKEIAQELSISVHTVRNHLVELFARAGASNRAELAAKARLGSCVSSAYRHHYGKAESKWEMLLNPEVGLGLAGR